MKYEVLLAGKTRVVEFTQENGAWKISLDGNPLDANAVEVAPNIFSVLLNGDSPRLENAGRGGAQTADQKSLRPESI